MQGCDEDEKRDIGYSDPLSSGPKLGTEGGDGLHPWVRSGKMENPESKVQTWCSPNWSTGVQKEIQTVGLPVSRVRVKGGRMRIVYTGMNSGGTENPVGQSRVVGFVWDQEVGPRDRRLGLEDGDDTLSTPSSPRGRARVGRRVGNG